MIGLTDAYLRNSKDWWIESPVTGLGNRLLLIQAGKTEVEAYEDAGWDVRSLVFAPGLIAEKSNKIVLASIWDDTWPLDVQKFDRIQCNTGFDALARSEAALLRRLTPCLIDSGNFCAQVWNPSFFAVVLAKASREIFPFPQHAPQPSGAGLEEVKTQIRDQGWEVIETIPLLDPLANRAEAWACAALDEWDVCLHLPREREKRELMYTRGWRLRLKKRAAESSASKLAPDALEQLHREIQELLETAQLREAGIILDKVFALGHANGRTYNLQGIWYFYRREFQRAWESFLMALTLAPCEDHAHNLLDAAQHIDRVEQSKVVIGRLSTMHPDLKKLGI